MTAERFRTWDAVCEEIQQNVQERLLMRELQYTVTAQNALGMPLSKEEKAEAKRWFNMGRPVEEFLDHVLARSRTR
jgi:hypothetical protein